MASLCRYRRLLCYQIGLHKYHTPGSFVRCSSRCLHGATLEKSQAEEIVIPKRIERSPTAILDALAATVRRDPYSPPYLYIDDPETLPTSSQDKKTFSLAQASGKRAAQHAIKRWPKSFATNPMDPTVEIPAAYAVYENSKDTEATVEHLDEMIHLHYVEKAYAIYQKLKEAETTISQDLHEDLLDLLCVYNSKNHEPILDEENLYARVLTQDSSRQNMKNTWIDQGPADTVFNDMDAPSVRAYSNLLKGMVKYFQIEKSIALYREMNDKGMVVDVVTYCSIIKAACLAQNQLDGKITVLKKIFSQMKDNDIKPTVAIFSTAFNAINQSHIRTLKETAVFAGSLLSEMYACGLEPTLAVWYHILRIVYRENDCNNNAIHEIINRLEGKSLVADVPDDMEFFSTAMVKTQLNLNNLELAYKIDELLNTDNNYTLIGSNFLEGLYYNFFFKLLCSFDDMDTIMEYYHKSIPHWYTPTFTTIKEFTQAIELNEGYQYLPELWSDMYYFRYHRYPHLMSHICQLAAKPIHKDPTQTQLYNLCCALYKEIKFTVMIAEEKGYLAMDEHLKVVNADVIGNMWQICLNSHDVDTAKEMFGFYQDYKSKMAEQLPEKAMERIVDVFIEEKDFTSCVNVLAGMYDYSYICVNRTAEKIKSLIDLSPDQVRIVDDTIS